MYSIMKKKKIRSLSDQLNELNEVAPAGLESDEEAYDAVREENEGASEEDSEDEARSHARNHYFTPSSSRLRKQADFLEGANAEQRQKYQGVKTTRKELLGAEMDSENDASEQEKDQTSAIGSEESESESLASSQSTSMSQNPIEATKSGQMKKKRKSVHFDAMQEADDDNEAKRSNAAQADAEMIRSLKLRTREDAAKGRDVRKQRSTWGKLLSVRIRAQKVMRAAGRIPSRIVHDDEVDMAQEDKKALDMTLDSLCDISRHLFDLQRQILDSFAKSETRESTQLSASLPALLPMLDEIIRPRKTSSDGVSDCDLQIDTLLRLDSTVFEPIWREVLKRWSNRTSSSLSEETNRNKFQVSLKAMNQSAVDQIDRGLSGDAFERLRKRTRVWRGTEQESRIQLSKIGTKIANEDESDGEEDETSENVDIFDDSDFYSALLRELIDSRGSSAELSNGVDMPDSSLIWAQAAKSAAKKNRNGELKVSKGRKIRYDVIEKVEHFMPPVPRETWSKEQIERLFRQISGAAQNAKEMNGEGDQITIVDIGESEGDLGGLRLF